MRDGPCAADAALTAGPPRSPPCACRVRRDGAGSDVGAWRAGPGAGIPSCVLVTPGHPPWSPPLVRLLVAQVPGYHVADLLVTQLDAGGQGQPGVEAVVLHSWVVFRRLTGRWKPKDIQTRGAIENLSVCRLVSGGRAPQMGRLPAADRSVVCGSAGLPGPAARILAAVTSACTVERAPRCTAAVCAPGGCF